MSIFKKMVQASVAVMATLGVASSVTAGVVYTGRHGGLLSAVRR